MKVFKEFLLDKRVLNPQTLYLPNGAEIVNLQDTEKGLMLLALVTPDECAIGLPELRTFKICTPGEKIYFDAVKYISSFNSLTGLRHVIEINKGV